MTFALAKRSEELLQGVQRGNSDKRTGAYLPPFFPKVGVGAEADHTAGRSGAPKADRPVSVSRPYRRADFLLAGFLAFLAFFLLAGFLAFFLAGFLAFLAFFLLAGFLAFFLAGFRAFLAFLAFFFAAFFLAGFLAFLALLAFLAFFAFLAFLAAFFFAGFLAFFLAFFTAFFAAFFAALLRRGFFTGSGSTIGTGEKMSSDMAYLVFR